jgi:hypothetical protein
MRRIRTSSPWGFSAGGGDAEDSYLKPLGLLRRRRGCGGSEPQAPGVSPQGRGCGWCGGCGGCGEGGTGRSSTLMMRAQAAAAILGVRREPAGAPTGPSLGGEGPVAVPRKGGAPHRMARSGGTRRPGARWHRTCRLHLPASVTRGSPKDPHEGHVPPAVRSEVIAGAVPRLVHGRGAPRTGFAAAPPPSPPASPRRGRP